MRTSRVGRAEGRDDAGFTLIEIICVLAVIALLAAIVLPGIPRATSVSRLEGYAVETAALLKADRNAAIRAGREVVTVVDADKHSVHSGATPHSIQFPPDVGLDALLAKDCNQRRAGPTIRFFPSGMSCGGVIALTRVGARYEVRVNWLTGGVEVVAARL